MAFLVFGALILGPSVHSMTWSMVAFAIVALTVVRMVPVAISLIGTGLKLPTVLYIGWFGPRGLASIVFIVMVVDAKVPGSETLSAVVTWTVMLSIIEHGMSAVPFAKMYAQRVAGRKGAV